jgi:hypothetical protein
MTIKDEVPSSVNDLISFEKEVMKGVKLMDDIPSCL